MPKYLTNLDLNQNQLIKAVVHNYNGDPNGVVAGVEGQLLFDTVGDVLYVSRGTTVWLPLTQNTDTITRLRTNTAAFIVGDISIVGSGAASVSQSGQTITIASTDTTYLKGNGLTLTGTTFALGAPSSLSSTSTNAVTTDSHTHAITNFDLTGTASVVSITGAARVLGAAGTINLIAGHGDVVNPYTSKTANFVLASPNEINGIPSFRALTATDIPNISTDKLTSGTLPVGRGGTGATTFTAGQVLVGNGTSALSTLTRSGIDTRTEFPPSAHNHDDRYFTETEADARFVLKAGDTLTGPLVLSGAPTQPLHAATKQYVDSVSEGLHIHASVAVATTANIAATYNNGTAGVGATLTIASTTVLDGYTLVNGDRILVKDQTTQAQNGIYVRTSATVWTRADDYNTATEIQAGDFVFVVNGTQFGSSGFVQTRPVSTVGTDIMVWSQFSGAGTSYIAGTGIAFNGNIINHSNTITAGNAGPASNATLTFGGTFTVPQIHYDAQGHVITNTATRTFTMPAAPAAPNNGTLTLTTPAGTTGTGVAVGTGTGHSANASGNSTYTINVGPAIPALATVMTGAGSGTLTKTGQDTFALVPTVRKVTSAVESLNVPITGATNVFNLDHNFGTREVVVSVRDNTTFEVVFVDVTMPTVNRVTLTFASNPGTDSYTATIIG